MYYVYRARTEDNQLVTGRVEADSLESAKKILLQHKLAPLNLSVPRTLTDYLPFLGKVSLKEKTLFARQLATMIEAGLSIVQALRLLVRQTKNSRFRSVLMTVQNDIQDGFSFSNALTKHSTVFDPVFVNVVRSGEATGKLEQVLLELAHNLEKDLTIRTKIRGALFYPGFIIVVMVIVGGIMTTKVIPQLKSVFLSSGQQLPGSTQFLIALSDFIIHDWFVMIIGTIGAVVGLRAFLRSPTGQAFYSKYSLKLPIAGKIISQSNMARFGRLLGMLINSGVPMLEALRLVIDSFTNLEYRKAMVEVSANVERGIPMSVPIENAPHIFPAIVAQMIAVGEQTGKMGEVMIKVGEYFDGEVDSQVGGLAALVEPFIIVLLGLGVAWLVQAVLLPIYQISTTVS